MLDDLRDQSSFQEEEETVDPDAPKPPKPRKPRKPRRSFDQITGMTAKQRFAVGVMLFIIVFLLGTTFLVISGKIVLSSFFSNF
jgi:hypothetical protein